MLSQYYELASQEVSFLQQSDHDKNVIRYYCQQKDQHFLYIAVELCQASLWDLFNLPDVRDEARYQQLQSLASAVQRDVRGTLYQLAKGLYHLHDLRIIHRDIKPQNILIAFPKPNKPNELRLVISDFGLCKTLPENVSTLIDPTSNAGTCGWKAPELISQPKDTASNNGHSNISHPGTSESSSGGTMGGVKRAADIFSLGCLFFWVLTGGDHPYDDKEGWMQMRELNIKKNNLQNMHKLDLGSDSEEPRQLITAMLAHNPEDRPSAQQVLCHPFFWSPKKRLDFLCDVSDHFEHEPRDPPSPHLCYLESYSDMVISTSKDKDWQRKLDRQFLDTLGKQRKYNGTKMLDLLRALRNKKNHYEDMSADVKKRVGSLPEGYLQYFTTRFPTLLMACFWAIKDCRVETNARFRSYYSVENQE
jgi:serine/threonine-protein kinase/endoribonuclease IRE1